MEVIIPIPYGSIGVVSAIMFVLVLLKIIERWRG